MLVGSEILDELRPKDGHNYVELFGILCESSRDEERLIAELAVVVDLVRVEDVENWEANEVLEEVREDLSGFFVRAIVVEQHVDLFLREFYIVQML